ncbi:hypothetical protein FACS1894141_6120 [Spirochaetia bacterium]|nr:hypothetical protein FACS1894141_6120 [Spirochaetia bacterium]
MVNRRNSLFVVLMALTLGGALAAGEVDVSIRYFDKKIYYVREDPIYVQVTIANNSPQAFHFKLANEHVFSVDFDIKTPANRAVEQAASLIRKRTTSQQIFFREVTVESGESFSFTEDLRDYAELNQSGSFIVQATIYPDLYRSTAVTVSTGGNQVQPLVSNRLSLSIRPPSIPGPGGIPWDLDVETNAILVREHLPPDQVVSYILTARQKEQWEKFFLYIDLEEMLKRDGPRQRQWLAESEEGRRRMIDRYRTEMQGNLVDSDMATIPSTFTIERTTYGAEEGTVVVMEYFQAGSYTERKRYTYYLHRRDDIWTITDYSVTNLGTE